MTMIGDAVDRAGFGDGRIYLASQCRNLHV